MVCYYFYDTTSPYWFHLGHKQHGSAVTRSVGPVEVPELTQKRELTDESLLSVCSHGRKNTCSTHRTGYTIVAAE